MSTTEIVLTVIGSVLGYALIGGLTAAVLAGISSARRTGYYDVNKAAAELVYLGGVFWPLVGPVAACYFGGRPVGRTLSRQWLRIVKRLNPNYAGTSV